MENPIISIYLELLISHLFTVCKGYCHWVGTAPFCDTSVNFCAWGWCDVKASKSGDGATCWTGEKSYCCRGDGGWEKYDRDC